MLDYFFFRMSGYVCALLIYLYTCKIKPGKKTTHRLVRCMPNHQYCQSVEGLKTTSNNEVYNFVGRINQGIGPISRFLSFPGSVPAFCILFWVSACYYINNEYSHTPESKSVYLIIRDETKKHHKTPPQAPIFSK